MPLKISKTFGLHDKSVDKPCVSMKIPLSESFKSMEDDSIVHSCLNFELCG